MAGVVKLADSGDEVEVLEVEEDVGNSTGMTEMGTCGGVEGVVVENTSTSNHTADNITPHPSKGERRGSRLVLRQNSVEEGTVRYQPGDETVMVSGTEDDTTTQHTTTTVVDPPITDLNLLLAKTYVEDARDGRHSDFKASERHLKLYHLYQSGWGQLILYLVIVVHLALALFERPAVPGLEMSYWVTMAMEVGVMCCYMVRLAHISVFTPLTRFWSDKKHIILIGLIVLTILDMVIYIGVTETGLYGVRWSRPLRPLFAVNFPEMRQIRRSFRNLRRTLPDVVNVLFLYFFSLSIFALMAYKLFGERGLKWVDGRPYFVNYWDSIFDLYVLVTTANNPDVMMPAFDESIYYVIFFVAFLIICYFIYMNIILAVIYNNYRKHLKNEVRKMVFSKRQQLSKAFEFLAVRRGNKRVVTKGRFVQLLRCLNTKTNPALINVYWIVLDSDGSDCLDKREFLKVADLLNVEVSEVVDRTTLMAHFFPRIYYSAPSRALIAIVKHRLFQAFFDLLTLINAVVIGVATKDSEWDDAAEWVFLSLFMLEIVLKMYALGMRRFFKRLWNVFDFVVIGLAFILGITEEIADEEQESRLTLDVLLVLRVLRLVKIVGSVRRFKVIVQTISKIVPSLLTYGAIMLVFYYVFAMVGLESFQGLIRFTGYDPETSDLYCSDPALEQSDFWRLHYCNNNFNDVIHAFIVLFELTVVNQWHVIAYGYAAVTDPWARLYFMLFHLVCVIVVLNIFTAFVLEVFILEYSASCQPQMETEMEKKIQELGLSLRKRRKSTTRVSQEHLVVSDSEGSDDDALDAPPCQGVVGGRVTGGTSQFYSGYKDISGETDVRFHISKRLKNVEVLLQKMFEKELSEDELGPTIDNLDEDLTENAEYLAAQNRTLWSL